MKTVQLNTKKDNQNLYVSTNTKTKAGKTTGQIKKAVKSRVDESISE